MSNKIGKTGFWKFALAKIQVQVIEGVETEDGNSHLTCKVLEDKKPYKVGDMVDLDVWEIEFN